MHSRREKKANNTAPRAARRQGNDQPGYDDGCAEALLKERRDARAAGTPSELLSHARWDSEPLGASEEVANRI